MVRVTRHCLGESFGPAASSPVAADSGSQDGVWIDIRYRDETAGNRVHLLTENAKRMGLTMAESVQLMFRRGFRLHTCDSMMCLYFSREQQQILGGGGCFSKPVAEEQKRIDVKPVRQGLFAEMSAESGEFAKQLSQLERGSTSKTLQ